MKLLKNYIKAAEALEQGQHYRDAASIYLKHAMDKKRAAQCYEKGNMTIDAIGIYKELNDNEKVGDLYVSISKRREADLYYEKVADNYKKNHQFVKASLIYSKKMNNPAAGQDLLMEGWRTKTDAINCLNNYFENISDVEERGKSIEAIYSSLDNSNKEDFLYVIRHEFKKQNELSASIQEKAYEIVASRLSTNPSIVAELKTFNPENNQLMKDTLRFSLANRQRKSIQ